MKLREFINQIDTERQMRVQSATEKNLEAILDIVRTINNSLILKDVLEMVLKNAIRITNSERGFIVLITSSGIPEFQLGLDSLGNELTSESFQLSFSVVEDVYYSGESRFIEEALSPDKLDVTKSILNLELQTIMCSPLTVGNQKIGVIYVDSRYMQRVRISEITSTFEILAGQAASAIKNAQLYNAQINLNGELKGLNDKLYLEKQRAEKANRLKSEFLAQVSHEIRSPLNVIMNYTSLLKEETEGLLSEEISDTFTIIRGEGNRIIRTVDMILNMSELQAGSYETILRPVDLYTNILQKLFKEYRQAAAEKGLEFILMNRSANPVITADEYSVCQIFQNLIDNAIKFTQKGGVKIEISDGIYDNERQGRDLIVSVSDTGIGISEEFRERIFQPFSQEDQGYSRRYDGNGLGLALSQKYCQLNDAEITLESRKDAGSVFTVTFHPPERHAVYILPVKNTEKDIAEKAAAAEM